MIKPLRFLLLALVVALSACTSDEPNLPSFTVDAAGKAIVWNQGNFGGGDGSLTLYDSTDGSVVFTAYSFVNGQPLGDVLQDVVRHNGQLYCLLNNSNSLLALEETTLRLTNSNFNLEAPRRFVAVSGTKAYVTEWGLGNFAAPGQLAVIDLNTLTITGRITGLEVLPEEAAAAGDTLLVGNATFGGDNVLSRVSISGDSLVAPLYLGRTPVSMASNTTGSEIYILGAEQVPFPGTPTQVARIYTYSRATGTLTDSTNLSTISVGNTNNSSGGVRLTSSGSTLYWLAGGQLDSMNVASKALSTWRAGTYSGAAQDPTTGQLYLTGYASFSNPGYIVRVSANGTTVLDSQTVGIQPFGATLLP